MTWYHICSLIWDVGPVFGVIAAVFSFFIWKDYRREMRLQDRIGELEKGQKDILLPLVEHCAAIIAQNTVVMIRLEKMLQKATPTEVKDEKDLLNQLLEDAAAHRHDAE